MITRLKYLFLLVLQCWLCGLVEASGKDSLFQLEKHMKVGIIETTRELMADSSFHVYLGHKLANGSYSLSHLCNFVDATYIFGIGPNLGLSSSIVSFFDHDVFEAAHDSIPQAYKFITLEFTKETISIAYSLTWGILTSGSSKNIKFHGVIFSFMEGSYIFDFAFEADIADEALLEFSDYYSELVWTVASAHNDSISFIKTPENNMNFSWDLRVNTLERTLITVKNRSILLGLLDYIHPAYLSDLTLVRSDQMDNFLNTELHELSFSSQVKKTELIVHQAIQNIEVGDMKIFGTKMNKGLDSIVALSFGELHDEVIDIKFKYLPDTERISEQDIELKEAISQMEGFWSFTLKYFKEDYWRFTKHKEAILEIWQDGPNKIMQSQNSVRSVSDLLKLAKEKWSPESFPDNLSLVLRPTNTLSVSQLPPFVRLGFADFLKTDLLIVLIRLYNMLFVQNTAEWTELIDSIIFRPAGSTTKVESVWNNLKYEVLIGIREGPSVKDMNLQMLMADIMHGVTHAASFANGLFKSSDGTVPLLNFGHQAYHKLATAKIEKKIKIIRPKKPGETGALQVYSFLYQPFQCYSLGPIESAFDDAFLDSLDTSTQIGTFLVLSKQALSRCQLENFTFKIKMERLLDFMRVSLQWTIYAKANQIDTLHGIAIQVTPIKKELAIEGMVCIGFGFSTNSSVDERKACTEFFKIDFSSCSSAGYGDLMDEFDEPCELDTHWTLSFKHGDEVVTRSFSDLVKLQYYMSWFKPETLKTASLVQNDGENPEGSKIVVDCKGTAMVRLLLFDQEDIWNILAGETWIYLWNKVSKIEFKPTENDPENDISVVLHFKFNDAACIYAKHLQRRRLLLVLIDPFHFSFNSKIKGKLKIGDHVQYILGSNALFKSMEEWPEKLKKKDVMYFRKLNDPLLAPDVDRIHAIRIVIKTQEAMELFALTMNIILGRVDPGLATASHLLLVRNVSAHTAGKKNRSRIPQDHFECILAFSRPPGSEMLPSTKILFLLVAIFEAPVIDISAGMYSLKSQTYTASHKLAIEPRSTLIRDPRVSNIIQNVVKASSNKSSPLPTRESLESNLRKVIKAEEMAKRRSVKATESVEHAKEKFEATKSISEVAMSKFEDETASTELLKMAVKEARGSFNSANREFKEQDAQLKQANERLNRIKRLERKRHCQLENITEEEVRLENALEDFLSAPETEPCCKTEAAAHPEVDLRVRLLSNNAPFHMIANQRRRLPLSYDTLY